MMASQPQKWCMVGPEEHSIGQEFHEVAAFMNSHFTDYPAATVKFDSQEELLWVGTESVGRNETCFKAVIVAIFQFSCLKF